MGNCFSGWSGRRSPRPYFDELPRLAIDDHKKFAPGILTVTVAGRFYSVRAIRMPSGCMMVPRLICAICRQPRQVLYLMAMPCCPRCTGARYRSQSEAPGRRALRRAEKVLMRGKFEHGRPGGKPKWMRWPTFKRLDAETEKAGDVLIRYEEAPYTLLRRVEAMRPRRRGRPRKQVR